MNGEYTEFRAESGQSARSQVSATPRRLNGRPHSRSGQAAVSVRNWVYEHGFHRHSRDRVSASLYVRKRAIHGRRLYDVQRQDRNCRLAKYHDFTGMIREQRISGPTARDFDPEAWSASRAMFPPRAGDDTVHAAGLWFHRALAKRWSRVEELGFAALEPAFARTLIAVVANTDELKIETMLDEVRSEGPDSLIGRGAFTKLGADPATAATADMRRTSMIDTIGKAVSVVGTSSRGGESPFDIDETFETLALFRDIYLLEFLWSRVLWLDWSMATAEGEHRFLVPNPDLAGRSAAVAQWRREQIGAEFAATFSLEWAAVGSVLGPCWAVKTRQVPGGYTFAVSKVSPGEGALSASYVSLELLAAGELAPHLDRPLERVDGGERVSLRDVVLGWELLAQAADGIAKHLADASRRRSPERLAAQVTVGALIKLLGHLGWSPRKSQAVIDFLTFNGKSPDGAWTKPLLSAGSRRLMLLTPLTCGSLERIAELWASEGAGEVLFAERGSAFEVRLRKKLAASASERPWSSFCVVVQKEWKPRIAGAPRDIDLIVRIGSTVFVGEVKIKRHPNSAAEIGRLLREFEKAADQLDVRVAFLRANSAELAKRTGYRQAPEQLKVFGFILSGTAFGSGLEIKNYPVIDTDALSFFFDNDEFLTYATIDRASGYRGIAANPDSSIRLVDDDPEVCLAAYIRDPLHVRHAEIAIERTERGEQLYLNAERLRWVEHHVKESLLGSEAAREVAAQLRKLMRAGQRRARLELATMPNL